LGSALSGVAGEKRGTYLRGLNGAVFEAIRWPVRVAVVKNGANRSNMQGIRDFVFVDFEEEIADHSNIVR